MDIVTQVMDQLGADENKARDGVGLMLFAIRVATDQKTFDAIKTAWPDAQSLFNKALAAGGRTAEMLALTRPEGVRKNLENARYTADEIARLGTLVTGAFAEAVDEESAGKIRAAVERVVA